MTSPCSSVMRRRIHSAGASSFRIKPSNTCARATPRPTTRLRAACQQWDNVDVVHRGQKITVRGNKFSGIARIHFLNVLQQRCLDVGVDLRFREPISRLSDLPPADLLVGADGANSLVRREHADIFGPTVEYGRNKYIWLGTPRLFHGLTLTFEQHPTGVYAAHSYKFDGRTSTFIVECSEATWRQAGLDTMDEAATCEFLQQRLP